MSLLLKNYQNFVRYHDFHIFPIKNVNLLYLERYMTLLFRNLLKPHSVIFKISKHEFRPGTVEHTCNLSGLGG